MFEVAAERWKDYLSQVGASWPGDDVRHNLGGEVRDRLRQLDRILKHLHAAIGAVSPDPVEAREKMEWALANRHRVAAGEMTQEEFIAGSLTTTPDPSTLVGSWGDISIFTEAFYFCAWRMIEVLNGGGPYSFPSLRKVTAPAITIVRNHLLQHPEKVKDGQGFTLGPCHLVILSSGPVLRSLGGVTRSESGQIDRFQKARIRACLLRLNNCGANWSTGLVRSSPRNGASSNYPGTVSFPRRGCHERRDAQQPVAVWR